jgi:hypothetical protein
LVAVVAGEQEEFVFLNNTLVVGENNTSETLLSVASVPLLTVAQAGDALTQFGVFDFGNISVNADRDIVFTLENSGNVNLTLSAAGGSIINLENNTSGFFSITQQPFAPVITPGNSAQFTLRFNPTSLGNNFTASVRIVSNSRTDSEFLIFVRGSCAHIVTFDRNGGDADASPATLPVPYPQTSLGTLPTPPVWEDYAFVGWNTQADGGGSAFTAATSVAADITVYAQWVDGRDEVDFGAGASVAQTFNVANATQWNSAVSAINSGGDDRNYIINITADFSIAGSSFMTFPAVLGVKVSLRGVGQTLSLSSSGRMLNMRTTQTVVLRGLALQGIRSNNTPVVVVPSGASFTMRRGEIFGNGGGGVGNSGTFTMHGGAISDNSNGTGTGGIGNWGTFTMHGGIISGNSGHSSGGGGVGGVLNSGTFVMHSGEISGNNGAGRVFHIDDYDTGGVRNWGTFTMHGGTISGNSGGSSGSGVGGVYNTSGTFRISNGTIYGSDAPAGNIAPWGFAALRVSGSATYGTLSGSTWISNGALSSTHNTIRVVNGVLQP